MSLADLRTATDVSLPTLRKAMQSLVDARWIRVVGQAEANGGRPAMLFGIDDSRFAIIGTHLQLPGIHLTLSDLAGTVLDDVELFDGVVPTPDQCIHAITHQVGRMRSGFPDRHILGIGVGAPGFIDLASGDILSIGRVPSWENVPVCRRLRSELSLPVLIANDVDCQAFAELKDTPLSRERNLAYIGFDEGVKISLFLKGEPYKGSLGNAGLIAPGLLRVDDLANPAEAGQLLTINGVSRLFESRLDALDPPGRAPYASILSAGSPRERVHRILDNARPDMTVCHALVLDQIKALAAMAAAMILMMQPDVVLIGGMLSLLPKPLFAVLETAIRGRLPSLIGNNTLIQQGRLPAQRGGATGAIEHFLQTLLAGGVSGSLP